MARPPARAPSRPQRRKAEPDGDRGRAALGYTRPRTYEELRAVLSSGTVHFPKRLRQVAIFLWQHPGEVALGTISEVADELDVPKHVLRFWEGKFSQLRPMKRGGGRRYYRPEDVDLLRGIRGRVARLPARHLVAEHRDRGEADRAPDGAGHDPEHQAPVG